MKKERYIKNKTGISHLAFSTLKRLAELMELTKNRLAKKCTRVVSKLFAFLCLLYHGDTAIPYVQLAILILPLSYLFTRLCFRFQDDSAKANNR